MTTAKTNVENEVFEDERKFLLKNDSWKASVTSQEDIEQGYLSMVDNKVTVKQENGDFFLNIEMDNGTGLFVFERILNEREYKALSENLYRDKKVLRIRKLDNTLILTIKIDVGIVGRQIEVERELLKAEYDYMLPLALTFVSKIRNNVHYEGKLFQIDEFRANNEGKVVAEVELDDINDTITLPDWIGEEVTHDESYSNYSLSKNK